ncbi:peroxiredoxin [uncultured Maricaulis sp.]|uniref:peroxiredoxin n=1 Tax=uncultured Maricaulis sp. TaxID=174710 RepID=UPI0030DD4B2C|tara:strand:+ start:1989 stop:2537 length:549 start_codon:yes stop_codon:yes gene_type:complete
MRRFLASLAVTACLTAPALADLEVGDTAPEIQADGFLGGEPFHFDLAEALAEGPVVMYFFPAAYTSGCNVEAALFAESAPEFAAAGATLVGLTAGNTDRLSDFSRQHCASAFPVAAVSSDVVSAYGVGLMLRPGWTTRTSYVIAPDGTIAFEHSEMSPDQHVTETLQALHDLGYGAAAAPVE